jgi:hypothetical protein
MSTLDLQPLCFKFTNKRRQIVQIFSIINNAACSNGQPCCCVAPTVYAALLPGLHYYCLKSAAGECTRCGLGGSWWWWGGGGVKLGNLYYVKVLPITHCRIYVLQLQLKLRKREHCLDSCYHSVVFN